MINRMPAYQQAQEYQRTQIETASPAQLVVLLYDGAIRFLQLARERMGGDLESRHQNLIKAQRIIAELLSSLNHEKGGPIAANLQGLYTYMLQQLVEANLYDDGGRIDTVVDMLRALRASWAEVERAQSGATSAGTHGGDSASPGARRVAIGG